MRIIFLININLDIKREQILLMQLITLYYLIPYKCCHKVNGLFLNDVTDDTFFRSAIGARPPGPMGLIRPIFVVLFEHTNNRYIKHSIKYISTVFSIKHLPHTATCLSLAIGSVVRIAVDVLT